MSGIFSRMVVQKRSCSDATIIDPESRFTRIMSLANPFLDLVPLEVYRERPKTLFHPGWISSFNSRLISKLNPEIVHLHWICRGFLRIEQIKKIAKPIVWTFHDSWPFTGGCHLPFDCMGYTKACGRCPQLASSRERDLSRRVWNRKKRSWKDIRLTIVAPSTWMAKCVRASSLFRDAHVEVIPNGLDLTVFRPMSGSTARDILKLPQDKTILLFGAFGSTSEKAKGFQFLLPVLYRLRGILPSLPVELVVFGSKEPKDAPDFGLRTHYTGVLNDEISLAILYAAADLFIAPFIQDNLSSTVMESLACGTPCVAFDTGGMSDMIEHKRNGYLAKPFDTDDFANGVNFVLGGNSKTEEAAKARIARLRERAREKVVQEFDMHTIAKRHKRLYEQLLANDP